MPHGDRGDQPVDIATVRDLRDQILREMADGFAGVHRRQDVANGRTLRLEENSARYDERINSLEEERDSSHMHRRATDPAPVPTATEEAEKRSITRWDVGVVLGTFGGTVAVLKFLEWFGFIARAAKP